MRSGPKLKKRTKIILISCAAALLLALLAPLALSVYIYEANFGLRFETPPEDMRAFAEFGGLNRDRYTFSSNRGQTLAGYHYFADDSEGPKGVVIIAHGFGGGGHNYYMDTAAYLASGGYAVFAYDATGNDESEGDAVGGMPQGVIDLDHAIRFVKETPAFAGLPIMLFGHSWGAYSSGSVLSLHPDVGAAVLGAGFNRSTDILEEEGRRQAGAGVDLVLPYLSLIERLKFGEYASSNCVDGFNASNAGVMIIHSADDEVVSFEKNYLLFEELFQNDPRFVFVRYEDRGHNGVFEQNGSLDPALMKQILAFYDSHAQ